MSRIKNAILKNHEVSVRYEVSVRQGLRKELGLRKNNKINMRKASKPKV
jgi:hypothetical protein